MKRLPLLVLVVLSAVFLALLTQDQQRESFHALRISITFCATITAKTITPAATR